MKSNRAHEIFSTRHKILSGHSKLTLVSRQVNFLYIPVHNIDRKSLASDLIMETVELETLIKTFESCREHFQEYVNQYTLYFKYSSQTKYTFFHYLSMFGNVIYTWDEII